MGTVRAELAFPLENRGAAAGAVARGVEEVALALGIEALLDRSTRELSGGELQRVALGAALAGRPRLVLLDEPTSQLDPVAGDELVWLLRRLNEEWGTAVVLAEHRLERCLAHADRVIVLARRRGRLRRAAARRSSRGPASARPRCRRPARGCSRARACARRPAGVKEARATLRAHGLLDDEPGRPARGSRGQRRAGDARGAARGDDPARVARCAALWLEMPDGRAVLRGVDLRSTPGERVALMGRNGAGQVDAAAPRSAGLRRADPRARRGAPGGSRCCCRTRATTCCTSASPTRRPPRRSPPSASPRLGDRHPRDLSGGERQRLALAIVLRRRAARRRAASTSRRAAWTAATRARSPTRLRELAASGAAVLVATHDAEFAAAFAERVVLLGRRRARSPTAPTAEVLAGGWYFATETARIVGRAALLPRRAPSASARCLTMEVDAG